MSDLTKDWKDGKLPAGWYWVKGIKSEGIYAYTAEYLNNMYRPINGERIIEQVPSYEQWQKHRKTLLKTQEKNCDLEIINIQLKELLEECSPYIGHSATSRTIKNSAGHKKDMKLLTKIDEALR